MSAKGDKIEGWMYFSAQSKNIKKKIIVNIESVATTINDSHVLGFLYGNIKEETLLKRTSWEALGAFLCTIVLYSTLTRQLIPALYQMLTNQSHFMNQSHNWISQFLKSCARVIKLLYFILITFIRPADSLCGIILMFTFSILRIIKAEIGKLSPFESNRRPSVVYQYPHVPLFALTIAGHFNRKITKPMSK